METAETALAQFIEDLEQHPNSNVTFGGLQREDLVFVSMGRGGEPSNWMSYEFRDQQRDRDIVVIVSDDCDFDVSFPEPAR